MNDVHDFDFDDDIRGLWNRQRARLPRFDAAHRETVLAAVADAVAAPPAVTARQPIGFLVAAVAAAIFVALPSWLVVVSLPALAHGVTSGPMTVSLAARAELVGVALAADGDSQVAAVSRPRESGTILQAPVRGVLRSINVHTMLDAPSFILGETF